MLKAKTSREATTRRSEGANSEGASLSPSMLGRQPARTGSLFSISPFAAVLLMAVMGSTIAASLWALRSAEESRQTLARLQEVDRQLYQKQALFELSWHHLQGAYGLALEEWPGTASYSPLAHSLRQNAIAYYEECLRSVKGDAADGLLFRVRVLQLLSKVHAVGGDYTQAERHAAQALGQLDELWDPDSGNLELLDNLELLNLLAQVSHLRGKMQSALDQPRAARESLEGAWQHYQQLGRELLDDSGIRSDVSLVLEELARIAVIQGRLDDSVRLYQQLCDMAMSRSPGRTPGEEEYEIAVARQKLAAALKRSGKFTAAAAILQQSQAVIASLPNDDLHSEKLLQYCLGLAIAVDLEKQLGNADQSRRMAERLALQLERLDAETAEAAVVGQRLKLLGQACREQQLYSQAAAVFRRAKTHLEQLVFQSAAAPELLSEYGTVCQQLADVLREQGNFGKARQLLKEALTHQSLALEQRPDHVIYRQRLARHWSSLALLSYNESDWTAAANASQRSLEVRPDGDPLPYLVLALASWKSNQPEESDHWYQRAAQRIAASGRRNPDLLALESEAAQLAR